MLAYVTFSMSSWGNDEVKLDDVELESVTYMNEYHIEALRLPHHNHLNAWLLTFCVSACVWLGCTGKTCSPSCSSSAAQSRSVPPPCERRKARLQTVRH